jgi:hypothetical protein
MSAFFVFFFDANGDTNIVAAIAVPCRNVSYPETGA